MPSSSSMPIPLPPRVNQGDPVTALWANKIRDAIYRLSMRGGNKPVTFGGSITLPFACTSGMEGEDKTISVKGGAWQEGSTGAWTVIDKTEAAVGDYAYLVIEQDVDRAITGVTVEIETTALDPVIISGGGTATSNVLLAEFETVDGITKLIQRRHGNFTIGLWQIDGDVVRWPETLVGTIPTPEPPP